MTYLDQDAVRVDLGAFSDAVQSRVPSIPQILAVCLCATDTGKADFLVAAGLVLRGVYVSQQKKRGPNGRVGKYEWK
jgi:hypothetical protein